MMTFNKKLITGAVGAALTLGLGMSTAQAGHELLFPYVTKDGTNKTTLVTVIGYVTGGNNGDQGELHLQYWSKFVTDANTAPCLRSSVPLPFTDADMVTFDTGGVFGFPLFGDITNGNASDNPSMAGTGARHGYLVAGSGDTNFNGSAGYWLELDLLNGGAHGDMAAHFSTGSQGGSISNAMALYHDDRVPVQFLPTNAVKTEFTVTPLGQNFSWNSTGSTADTSSMRESPDNTAAIGIRADSGAGYYFDRNEKEPDGGTNVTVTCVGRVTMGQLFPLVSGSPPLTTMGGWARLWNVDDNSTVTQNLNAMVYQVESATAGGKYFINATRIASDDGED